MTTMSKLGLRQRQILELMHRHEGVWPPRWTISSYWQPIFDSLERRGLITQVRAYTQEGVGHTYRVVMP